MHQGHGASSYLARSARGARGPPRSVARQPRDRLCSQERLQLGHPSAPEDVIELSCFELYISLLEALQKELASYLVSGSGPAPSTRGSCRQDHSAKLGQGRIEACQPRSTLHEQVEQLQGRGLELSS